MKVHVVCRTDQLDWILGKIARQLVEELKPLVQVSLGPEPGTSVDVNHYVWYDDFHGETGKGKATIGITHIDSLHKLELIREQLKSALAGICLSSKHMEDLIHAGISSKKLCYVTPGHDSIIAPKKLQIGITTRLYPPDPCKREWMLEELSKRISPLDFSFSIMGSGWDPIVQTLRHRGFQVAYYPKFDLERYRAIVPTFDYYLYLGWDEGSMGLLDALHAGVKTIATSQGFHLDIKEGLTHPIDDLESLISVLVGIAQEKSARTNSVRELTWPRYAHKHLEIWEYLLFGHQSLDRGEHRDGLNSLLISEPARDPVRGKAFLAELEKIDQERVDLEQIYQKRVISQQHVVVTTGPENALRVGPAEVDVASPAIKTCSRGEVMTAPRSRGLDPADRTTSPIKASVIVPTRNRAGLLLECLTSLANQGVSADHFEILIIDNASTDDTGRVSAEFIRSHPDHRIRYVQEPVLGLLAGRHRGTIEASADILCFVDDDIIADSGWLKSVLGAFDVADVHLVGGPCVARFEEPPPFWLEHFKADIPEGHFLDCLSLIDLGPVRREIPAYYIWGLNFSIRKCTLLELGGFHPDGVPTHLLRYRGDGEGGLSHKLLEKGYKSVYHPGARVEHVISADRLQLDYLQQRRFLQGISDSYTQIRNKRGTENISLLTPPDPVQPRMMESARKFLVRLLRYEADRAYTSGSNFHLKEVRSDPELLAWVLKPNYLQSYEYR